MELEERVRRAGGSAEELASVLFDAAVEVLVALLDNPRLNEEHLKVLLSRKNLRHTFLRELCTRERLLKSYAIKLALVRHPHTPRTTSLTLLRHLYTFDLAKVASTPAASPEIRRSAEEALLARLSALPLGERLALARQATARLAAGLLADSEAAVVRVALDSPRLTEEGVVRTLREAKVAPHAVEMIAEHPRWARRYEVRLALIRQPATSLRRMLVLIDQVRHQDLADIVEDRKLPPDRKRYLARVVETRRAKGGQRGRATGSSSAASTVF